MDLINQSKGRRQGEMVDDDRDKGQDKKKKKTTENSIDIQYD
jgi:hypothetical protein